MSAPRGYLAARWMAGPVPKCQPQTNKVDGAQPILITKQLYIYSASYNTWITEGCPTYTPQLGYSTPITFTYKLFFNSSSFYIHCPRSTWLSWKYISILSEPFLYSLYTQGILSENLFTTYSFSLFLRFSSQQATIASNSLFFLIKFYFKFTFNYSNLL